MLLDLQFPRDSICAARVVCSTLFSFPVLCFMVDSFILIQPIESTRRCQGVLSWNSDVSQYDARTLQKQLT